ncbi:MAG: Gldg family protein, partial [Planctomycetota bacterium]
TQVICLDVLGDPDWGVLTATYVGYWLAGVALLSVGMFASSLTESATVAFVLGAIFCAIPVLLGYYFRGVDFEPTLFGALAEPIVQIPIERFGFEWNLREFTLGLIPLSNVMYFLALTVLMLYLNLIVVSKRHWNRGEQVSLGGQYLVRAASLGIALFSIVVLGNTAVSSVWSRADMTAEKLYTLDPATMTTLNKIKETDREVTIQAFVSKEVPRKYANTKKQFLGLLRQFSEYGGKNVVVRYVDVTPNSQAALDAKQKGIEPVDDRSEVGGRVVEQKVYMGAAVSTSIDDVALPFVGEDDALEYELSRSIAATIDKENQITVGVLDTDAYFGGPELDGRRVPWSYSQTLDELKKQFKIKNITGSSLGSYVDQPQAAADGEGGVKLEKSNVKEPPSVLLVADPSSLDDAAMDSLVKYVEAGNPTILLMDPLPYYWAFQDPTSLGILNAPRQARVSQRSRFPHLLSSSPAPKSDNGSASKILASLGVQWNSGEAAWTTDVPHPSFKPAWPDYHGNAWPEYYGVKERALVFARDHGEHLAFNDESPITNGLNEVLMFYPGSFQTAPAAPTEFEPLVSLDTLSGSTPWEDLTMTPMQETRMLDPRTGTITSNREPARSEITSDNLVVLNPTPPTNIDDQKKVLAARVTGGPNKINVVLIADMDFVTNLAFIQEDALYDQIKRKLDNVALLQNSIEVLAGNEGFVSLRNRRPKARTLEKLESLIEKFRVVTQDRQKVAEEQMKEELELEQAKLDEANREIQSDEQLGFFEKLQRTSQQASDAQRRFDLKQKKLERELKVETDRLKMEQQENINRVETQTRYLSIFAAPLPALLLGIVVLWIRKLNEERNINPERKV